MYRYGVVGVATVGLLVVSHFALSRTTVFDYVVENPTAHSEESTTTIPTAEEKPILDTREVVEHIPLPEAVKAIYMTSCVVGTTDFRKKLVTLVDETEINAIVIDIKDFSGTLSFPPISPEWTPAWQEARCGTRDMKEFIASLHEKGIYVIARITVFQDPFYTKNHPDLAVAKRSDGTVWRDRKGLSFIDVGAKPYWDHLVTLSTDAYNIGFDELNFDYVRYPSDGNMQDIAFPQSMKSPYGADKPANLEAFFKYLNEKLDDESRFSSVRHEHTGRASSTPWTSVDLFGMTTTNTDDLSIGQVQERAAPYFDFVAPMVYPSHYPNGFMGLSNPNLYPYKVVNYAMSAGVKRMMSSTTPVQGFLHTRIGTSTPAEYTKPVFTGDRLRTWIQDFKYGGNYDANAVRSEIQASYDAGVNSFMIWSPSNIYTKEALKSAE